MRVLYLVDPFLPVPPAHYGGIERIVASVIRGALARGHEATLLAHPGSRMPGARLWPLCGGTRPGWPDHARNLGSISRAISRTKPDLIHSFTRLAYLAPVLGARLPKIMAFHREPTPWTVRWAARLDGRALTFTGCSDFITRRGAACGGRWHSIPNGIEIERYAFRPQAAPDAPLVFLSRLERVKGPHLAIAAARAAGRPLILAGNRAERGPEADYFTREIAPHLGRDGISFVGPVDDPRKSALLGGALALIVPIQWEEPFGMVFAEALACGTPVISMRRGALPEIVEDGRHGFLCAHPAELPAAIAQAGKIDRPACRLRAEEFSAEVMAQRHEALYEQISAE